MFKKYLIERNIQGIGAQPMEALCGVARKLKVLSLVFTNRHKVGIIEQNIGSHKGGIIEKADANLFPLLLRFFFKLSHSLHPSHRNNAIENPSKFRMRADMRLDKQYRLLWVNTRGKQNSRHLAYI